MFRDLAASDPLRTDQPSSVRQNSIQNTLDSFPIDQEPAEKEAQLIMRRLVRAYLERRPMKS
jgi:hypothetical protein